MGRTGEDKHGNFVHIRGLDANFWFSVAKGKTDKQTLAHALKRIKARYNVTSYGYAEDVDGVTYIYNKK